jgi:IS5 family transposase
MYKESDGQESFFGGMIYERIVPKEHFLRRLSGVVDLNFVNEACKGLYSQDNGRPCWEPVIIFKMLLLQYLYNLSDVMIENEVQDRLSFKWFLGIEADAKPPDATTLVRFRERLGADKFAELFNKIVDIARGRGLVSDKLHIVDAMSIKAKVDLWSIRKEYKKKSPDKDVEKDDINKNSPDGDARFGYSSGPGNVVYGYKGYIEMDKDNEIIVSGLVDSADKQEANHLPVLIDKSTRPKTLVADKAYDTKKNQQILKERGIRSGILRKDKPKKPRGGFFYNGRRPTKKVMDYFRKIRQIVEHKIAEIKRWHLLGYARYWGLAKVRIQTFMTFIAVNVKRFVNIAGKGLSPPKRSVSIV